MAVSALSSSSVSISRSRLLQRLEDLGTVGSTGDGGCCRLALTDEDRLGRDLLVTWMRDLGLDIDIDAIGNITGTWKVGTGAPVMTGSHIDTVRTGGLYDGNLGVIAGLEVIETLMSNGLMPPRPLAVTAFTNEEGARFQPDMLGSLVYVGGLELETALDTVAIDGARLGDELARVGYQGSTPVPAPAPHAFVELHIEQGPVLEQRNVRIGAVTGVQGISWQEVTIHGQSNHAGTTPMSLRHDPAYVAAEITVFLRQLADELGGHQVCTVGKVDVFPNLINVVPARVMMTLDVRNTDEDVLRIAERRISEHLEVLERSEGVRIERRVLARFAPVVFCNDVIDIVESSARRLCSSTMRLPSGAGHDAQMLARNCPTAMIFTPSVKGISHNPAEYTAPDDLELGTNVLLHSMWELAHRDTFDFTPGSGT
ncbi:MAG: M20 family metallo-hydrolase [Actinomycetota bacterium]